MILSPASPAQGLTYNLKIPEDKIVHKIIITTISIDDERRGGKFKNNRIETILSDGSKIIGIDRGMDGIIDDRIIETTIDRTKIIETDWNNNA